MTLKKWKKKNFIHDIDVLIYLDFNNRDEKKFTEIKNKYIEYFFDIKKN